MIRDPLHAELHGDSAPAGPAVRCRLIPALNPCWRLWMREEGPLDLVCLAQIALELWSVQTDGVDYYFCHNRMVRKAWPGCVPSLRRDIGSVRGGFVREARVHLGAQTAGTTLFGRERAPRPDATGSTAPGAPAATAPDGSPPPDAPARPPAGAVQVSYRRRRHVDVPSATPMHA